MRFKLFEYQSNQPSEKLNDGGAYQLSKKNGVANNLMESAWSISKHLSLDALKLIWMAAVVILFVYLLILVALDERFSDKEQFLFRPNS